MDKAVLKIKALGQLLPRFGRIRLKGLNTTQFKELNLRLQSTGQTVMCLFEVGKG